MRKFKLNRWELVFSREEWRRSYRFSRPRAGSIADDCFNWWVMLGPLCLFRLKRSRLELEKNL